MRYLSIPVLVLCSLAAVAACGPAPDSTDGAPETPPRADGAPAPLYNVPPGHMRLELLRDPLPVDDITMETLDGEMISTGDWGGKVTLVNYWATWCGPCREEIPDLIRLQDRYPDQLQVVGISTDEGDPSDVRAFCRGDGDQLPGGHGHRGDQPPVPRCVRAPHLVCGRPAAADRADARRVDQPGGIRAGGSASDIVADRGHGRAYRRERDDPSGRRRPRDRDSRPGSLSS